MQLLRIKREISPKSYWRIVDICKRNSDIFGFVVHLDMSMLPKGLLFVESISQFLIDERLSCEWPGTITFEDNVMMRRYQLCDAVVSRIRQVSSGISDWIQPNLPEDIFFMRGNDVVMETVSHDAVGAIYPIISANDRLALIRDGIAEYSDCY